MKKLMYSTIALTCFSISLLLFQFSCQKEATAKATSAQAQNKFLYIVTNSSENAFQYWVSDIDGTNNHQISVTMPSPYVTWTSAKLSQDGSTIIFKGWNPTSSTTSVWSVSINGGSPTKLFDAIIYEIDQTF